jgi:UDP-N-acetylglucosamine 2-epimerase (non-hydrolysing)
VKIVSLVGARPNFIKIAPLVNRLKLISTVEHILVHSGQHYDDALSGSFFRDLGLPEPDVSLQVGSGSHAWQTAEIMKRLEPVLIETKPDILVVVGDVNSTLAGALTAVKLSVPLAHVEAGLRSFDMRMPEEINRRITDIVSNLLFVTEESGVENLRSEGVPANRIFLVGNVMIDSLLRNRSVAAQSNILKELQLVDGRGGARPYALLTLHRPSNVDNPSVLEKIMKAVTCIGESLPVLFPVHPRTRGHMKKLSHGNGFGENSCRPRESGVFPIVPLGYLDFLCLMDQSRLVLTDSGGIQEETTALGIPCLTLRENTERPATIRYGTNQLVGQDPEVITRAARKVLAGDWPKGTGPPLWDGEASQRIVSILLQQSST